jgi:hypothetical protein
MRLAAVAWADAGAGAGVGADGGGQAKMPFAVIGSEQEYDVAGKKVRGRKYPWGVLEGVCGTGRGTDACVIITEGSAGGRQSRMRITATL